MASEAHEEIGDGNAIQHDTVWKDEEEGIYVCLRAGFGADDGVRPLRRRVAVEHCRDDVDA